MGELGGTIEYLYWSKRRTSRFLEDNDLTTDPVTRTITSPSFNWFPTFSRSSTRALSTRPQISKVIENALGDIAVSRFDTPGPVAYAKGTSTVVFGEFALWHIKPSRKQAVIFTSLDYDRDDRSSVAVCLYGSMDNFLEYVQDAGPGFDGDKSGEGWVSSSAPAIFDFLQSQGKQLDPFCPTPEHMALEALKIADGQGIYHSFHECSIGTDRPWRRSYTYGDARKAEWLAQIYLDVDLEATGVGREDGFRRVLVGAPLWIRTPKPRAVRLYALSNDRAIRRERAIQARLGLPISHPTVPSDVGQEGPDSHHAQTIEEKRKAIASPEKPRSQPEEDALHAFIFARNCLLYENDRGSEVLNVGTALKPLRIPRSEAWQQSYSMHTLSQCDGDRDRLLAARKICASHGEDRKDWSRAVDLCDQAIRVIEGAGATDDEKARKALLALCEYENAQTTLGPLLDARANNNDFAEELRKVGATMSDVPSPEKLVSWAFPWL